ncbi:MAG: DNA translocase FtsK 4TM domain-containing protein [Aridibacter famidurans]|nr:DNA translocase FtsK 4TM domain-containing protein [Aridibacter famidurans]
MAVRTNKKTASQKPSHFTEVIGIAFLLLALLTALSLVSYNPADWSLSTSSSVATTNFVGPLGSVIADLFFQVMGSVAYLVPLIFAIFGIRYLFSKSLETRLTRVIGVLLFVTSGSVLLTLFGFYGGILGAFFYTASTSLLNDIGTGVVFGALLLASIVLVTSFSYSSFFESIHLAASNFRIRFGEWREKRKALNAAAEAKPAAKTVAKKEPEPVQRPLPTISDGSDAKRLEPESDEPLIADGSDVFRKIETAEGEKVGKAKAAQAGASASEAGSVKEKVDDAEEPEASEAPKEYQLPSVEFLTVPSPRLEQDDDLLRAKAKELTEKADEFNVKGKVEKIGLGPVVTTYEFKPDAGVKYARVTGLADDLCLALEAESVMIERIPGTAFVGIEVPNEERETIFLRDVIESDKFTESTSLLSIALGKRIDGTRQIADLAKMPHLLIAGATGAGKSVGVNSLIVSILYKAKPEEVKFIMVDPKRLELGVYADIPHLAAPIITEPKRASTALKWAVSEMERRYKDLAGWGVRNIDGYNNEVRRRNSLEKYDEEGNPHRPLPYIVIIIDELADLMMVSGKEVEESITRLAQMARAVGIHLVLATQRPSVDVITGLIKANFPARISFRVSSKIDSRTIIDANGAERLLGKGDMLFLPPATSQLIRVHGAYVDEKEIRRIVDHIKAQAAPEYDETITQDEEEMDEFGDLPGRKDELFEEALKTVVGAGRASTSLLQRHLRIGYGRAAAILDALVADGFIGDMDSTKRARPVLQKAYEAVQEVEEGREF